MGLYLVPTDAGHLADVGLKDQVLANIREKVEIAINDMANDPRIVDKPDDDRRGHGTDKVQYFVNIQEERRVLW